jgi:peptidoglycan/xylan/chitin deacetylase (PgdA/CDA1 family)
MLPRLVLFLCTLLPLAVPAKASPVAITFDDLPALSLDTSTPYLETTTIRLLAELTRAHVPAIGFVNEIKLETPDKPQRIALLTQWLNAGMDLGNHSYSHVSLTNTPVEAYIADVERGETVTRQLLAARRRQPQWYRHPYLETGPTRDIRAAFEGWLATHGYRIAPVSMENSDWQFALPYDDAIIRHDQIAARHIRQEYLDFTARIIPWYRSAVRGMFGREPAFVLLLHATRLNADSFAQVAEILKQNDLQPRPLATVMTDPVYAIPDAYIGPDGISWLTRWSLALHKDLPWSTLPKVPDDIIAKSAALDAAAHPATPVPPSRPLQ